MTKLFRKDDCCCYNRTGERAAASFVNSGNANDTGAAQFLFVAESAAPIHLNRRLRRLRRLGKSEGQKQKRIESKKREGRNQGGALAPLSLVTLAPRSLLCPCGCGDNSAWRGGRGLPVRLRSWRCVVNAAENRAPHPRRRKCGAR